MGNVIIPHHRSKDFADSRVLTKYLGFYLCSPTRPLNEIISTISNAKVVYTESLHGAILADSLGVPWVSFVNLKHINIFKWHDWCSTLNIDLKPVYFPYPFFTSDYKSVPLLKNYAKSKIGTLINNKRYKLSPYEKLDQDAVKKLGSVLVNIFAKQKPSLSKLSTRQENIEKMIEKCMEVRRYGLHVCQELTT